MAHKHTFITKDGLKTKELTMASAIKFKCRDCCAWQPGEVKACTAVDCALHPFRFGKYPKK